MAYDTIDRHGMLQMPRVCGVGGKLLKVVQSFYLVIRACVWVGMDASEWFLVNVSCFWLNITQQGCVMSLWLFNVYMDGVMREEW